MGLPDSWTNTPGKIPEYLEAIKQAQAPERFSVRFLEGLGYKSTNDRKIIGVLKSLGFLDADGKPTPRYYEYLDLSRSDVVLAQAIREAFADLFAVNKDAHKLTAEQVRNRLRTLYAGSKKDTVINYIANTFAGLVKQADFEAPVAITAQPVSDTDKPEVRTPIPSLASALQTREPTGGVLPRVPVGALQYHINIVLPESRDQAVYDAVFKAMRDHLG